jgi:hypothetical protein
LFVVDGPCSRRMAPPYRSGSKISLNNRLKIGFIRLGGGAIEAQFVAGFYTLRLLTAGG